MSKKLIDVSCILQVRVMTFLVKTLEWCRVVSLWSQAGLLPTVVTQCGLDPSGVPKGSLSHFAKCCNVVFGVAET